MDYSKSTKKYWRTKIKERGVWALGGKCAICGGVFEDCCYDFHHLDPTQKEFTISQTNTNGARSWLSLRDELKKCALLCANCHRRVHGDYVEIENKNYFNDDYYEWELCEAHAVNTKTGEILDVSHECPICGGVKTGKAERCAKCAAQQNKQFEVSREELKEMIYTMPFTKIGEYFGVSDNSIRKRCKTFGLPATKAEIKKFNPEQWETV